MKHDDPLRAKKHFGQHFLVNQGVIERIAEQVEHQCRKSASPWAVEIGPGKGALTAELLRRGLKVVAVELDADMAAYLSENFSEAIVGGNFRIVKADALRVDASEFGDAQVICGNLPYNVGSAIVTRALKEWPRLKYFCFMLQKEVVEKFMAETGKDYGPASVRMKWMARVEGHFWVRPGSFNPPPKVDSGVFWYTRLNTVPDAETLESRMKIVDEVFSKRRKMLRASKKELAATPWAELRPEQVSAEDFVRLADYCRGIK